MKIPVLNDLQQEVNRLYIAGSKFAANDPRLKKFVPTLEAMAQKAPVFKKISDNLTALIQSDEHSSATHLFELGNLLYAILYTQSDTDITPLDNKQPLVPIVSIEDMNTNHRYSQVKPIIDALTTTSSGRYNIIDTAAEDGLLKDSRFYPYIAKAVNDKYSELSELIINHIIPSIGLPIVPFLTKQLVLDDTAINVKTLTALGNIKQADVLTILDQVVEENNTTKLLGVALEIYGNYPEREEVLYGFTTHKNAKVREGAIKGLAALNTPKAIEHMLHLLRTKKTETYQNLILDVLTYLPEKKHLLEETLAYVQETFDEFTQGAMNPTEKQAKKQITIYDFGDTIDILRGIQIPGVKNFIVNATHFFIVNYKYFDNSGIRYMSSLLRDYQAQECFDMYTEVEAKLDKDTKEFRRNGELNQFYTNFLNYHLYLEVDKDIFYDKFHAKIANKQIDFHHLDQVYQGYAEDAWEVLRAKPYRLADGWYEVLMRVLEPQLNSNSLYEVSTFLHQIVGLKMYFDKPFSEIEEFIEKVENSSRKRKEVLEHYTKKQIEYYKQSLKK